MTEPVVFGFPLSLLFLFFLVYAFLGWVMETCYCSILEKRFVARGFLYGPICPIYGVGALMMICWFAPLTGNPFLFYVVAVVCMSAWEYLVGWFLETTTHIKYWDYSMYRFNLHGRICLHICLIWGALAYVIIFWVHPLVAQIMGLLNPLTQHVLALVLLVVLTADATLTIRELMLVSRAMKKLNETGEELRLQLALGKAELGDYLGELRESLEDKLDDAKDAISDKLEGAMDNLSEPVDKVRAKYAQLLQKAEKVSRHLRYTYRDMSSKKLSDSLNAVAETAQRQRALREEKRTAKKATK